MTFLLVVTLVTQAGLQDPPPEPGPVSGLEAGIIFLRLDSVLGAEGGFEPGYEIAFHMTRPEKGYTIGLRAYYRAWDVTFGEFEQQPADLDGDVQQLGVDLVVTYPLLGPLSLGIELGGGGMRIEHDEDQDDSWFFETAGYLRLDLFAGLYIQAGGGAFAAFTEFGGQSDDTDHISWIARGSAGFEISF